MKSQHILAGKGDKVLGIAVVFVIAGLFYIGIYSLMQGVDQPLLSIFDILNTQVK